MRDKIEVVERKWTFVYATRWGRLRLMNGVVIGWAYRQWGEADEAANLPLRYEIE